MMLAVRSSRGIWWCWLLMKAVAATTDFVNEIEAPGNSDREDRENASYELISVGSVSLLILALAATFLHGCCKKNEDVENNMDSSTSSTIELTSAGRRRSGFDYEYDEGTLVGMNAMELVSLVSMSLSHFYAINDKNCPVDVDFVIPKSGSWPRALWNFPLGRILARLPCGGKGVSTSLIDVDTLSGTEGAEETNEQRQETWYELFYDLIFVAAALQLGLILKYDHRFIGLIRAGGLFLIMRSTWDHLTFYQNRFHKDDLIHIAYYTIQSMGTFIMALNLQVGENPERPNEHFWDRHRHQIPIAMTCTLLRSVTVIMYFFAQSRNKGRRDDVFRIICHTSLSAIIFAASTFFSTEEDDYTFLFVWILAIIVERPLLFLLHVLHEDSSIGLLQSLHLEHFIDRYATFFMLILGEAVIQLVQSSAEFDMAHYARELLGFMVVFNVGSVYHEQQMREPAQHVLSKSPTMSILWIEMQSMFSMSILFYCVGVKLVFHEYDETKELRDEMIMCGFASISLLLMYSMNVMHDGFKANFVTNVSALGHNLFRFTMSFLIGVIPFFMVSTTMTVVFLFIMTSFLVLHDILIRSTRIAKLSTLMQLRGKSLSKLNWKNAMDSTHHFTK